MTQSRAPLGGWRGVLHHVGSTLCLGHGADNIKDYFVNYDETVSNDFVMTNGGEVDLLTADIHDWRSTFVATGH